MTGINKAAGEVRKISNKSFKKLITTTTIVAASAIACSAPANAFHNGRFSPPIIRPSNPTPPPPPPPAPPPAPTTNGVWELSGSGFNTDASAANQTNITNNQMNSVGRGDLDLPENHTVNLYQDKDARFVAIDTENDPTDILGNINAQGTLFILDENGIFFGENAVLNVGSIVASTGTFENQGDFLNNGAAVKLGFANGSDGRVVNRGEINVGFSSTTAQEAGMAAFVSPFAVNRGVINAKMGKVILAAGETPTLDFYGDGLFEVAVDGELGDTLARNDGTINAQGGIVQVTAKAAKNTVDTVINMQGITNVSSVTQKGGKIILSGGDDGIVRVAGKMDASGTNGGDIDVSGKDVNMVVSAELRADGGNDADGNTTGNGNGGNIKVFADNNAIFRGSYSAKGGALGGDGGFIETSGDYVSFNNFAMDIGNGGSWLIDPIDLTVDATLSGLITTQLDAGADVTATVTNDLFINSDIIWGGAGSFTGDAGNDLNVNANIQATYSTGAGNEGAITLLAGNNVNIGRYADQAMTAIQRITTRAGDVSLNATNGSVRIGGEDGYRVIMQSNNGSIDMNAGKSVVVSNANGDDNNLTMIDAGNNITMKAGLVKDNGQIKIVGGNGTNSGITIDAGNSVSGDLTMAGDNLFVKTRGGTGHNVKLQGHNIYGDFTSDITIVNEGSNIHGIGGEVVLSQGGILTAAAETISNQEFGSTRTIEITQNEGGSIQNAVDALKYSGPSVTYKVSVGDGEFNETITADLQNLTLQGTGYANTTTINVASGATGLAVTANNVTVDGFRFEADYDGAGTGVLVNGAENAIISNNGLFDLGTGIFVKNANNTEIKSNEIAGTQGTNGPVAGDGVFAQNSTGLKVLNNNIHDIGDDAIQGNNADGAIVSGNTVKNVGDAGIALIAGSSNVTVSGNTITDADSGFGIRTSGDGSVSITGNTLTNTGDAGRDFQNDAIHVDGAYSTGAISGNKVYGAAHAGVEIENLDTSLSVSGNEIDGAEIGIYNNGSDSSTIFANTVTDSDTGILVNPSAGVTVSGNTITAKAFGVSIVDSSNAWVKNNSINNAEEGIVADNAADIKISGNTVSGSTVNGIHVSNVVGTGYAGGQNDADIWANTVTSTGTATGILVENSAYATIGADDLNPFGSGYSGGNKISGGKDGVVVKGSDNAKVIYSTIHDVDGEGVNVEGGANAIVSNNNIDRTGENAIRLFKAKGTSVQRNDIDDAGFNGIAAINSSNVTINGNNDIDGTFAAGVALNGTKSSAVNGNVIANTGGSGVWAKAAHGVNISNNSVNGSWQNSSRGTGDGIHVLNTNGVTVDGNNIRNTKNGGDGVEVNNSKTVVIKNNFIGTSSVPGSISGEGIDVNNSAGTQITNNIVQNSASYGISVNPSPNSLIFGNDIDFIGRHAIYVQGSANVDVLSNTIGTRARDGIGGDGIHASGANNIEIKSNNIKNTARDGVHVNGGTGAYIASNTFIGGEGDLWIVGKNAIGRDAIHAENNANVKISANTVSGGSGGFAGVGGKGAVRNSIYVAGSDNAEIELNQLVAGDNGFFGYGGKSSGNDGIYVEESVNVKINKNKVERIGGDSIEVVNSSNAQILISDIDQAGGSGIKLSGSHKALISENDIRNVEYDGIYAGGSNKAVINKNYISRSDNNGIHAHQSDDILIEDNNVFHSYYDGIRVTQGYGSSESEYAVEIKDNTVRFSGDEGIEVHGSGAVLIDDNIITNAGHSYLYKGRNNDSKGKYASNGIHVGGASGRNSSGYSVTITNNNVAATADDGIEVHASGATLIGDNVIRNVASGFGRFVPQGADEYGADGIAVRNIKGTAYDGYAVKIVDNTINRTADDGIEVAYAGRTLIEDNEIFNAGAGEVDEKPKLYDGNGYDGFGADGIHVREIYDDNDYIWTGRSEEGGYYNYAVNILDNEVDVTGDDGIEVMGASSAVIADNEISHAGYGDEEYYGGGDFFGADGIHVAGVFDFDDSINDLKVQGNDYEGPGREVEDSFRQYALVIENNEIDVAADDGIQVLLSGDMHIAGNKIDTAGDLFGQRILGGDGISILTIGEYGFFGEDYTDIEIVGNTVENAIDDGIEVIGTNMNVLVERNDVTDSGDNGIALLSLDGFFGAIFEDRGPSFTGDVFLTGYNSTVINNTVSGSEDSGLYVGGAGHDDVIVAGNTFTDNTIGAEFQSGLIDLTGETNTIEGGEVGLFFNPAETFDFFPFLPLASQERAVVPVFGPLEPSFADMSLAGNTIGTTTFEGQSEYYVELDNGAFFAPGTPTVLNGLNATYDGINPASQGGFLTQEQFDQIEAGIYHFTDESSLGLFFFGAVPSIDQEDLFNAFGLFNGPNGNLNVTITGLPGLTQAGLLAQIAPAAGEEGTAESLAALEPAAGGQETNCWGDAINAAGSGQSVSFSFGGDDPEVALNGAAGCETGGI